MIHKRLELSRRASGLTKSELAEKIGSLITSQAISQYESGEAMPSSSVLFALAKGLDVSVDFLVSSQIQKVDSPEFEKLSKISERRRAIVEAEVIDYLERYMSIEAILNLPRQTQWIEQHKWNKADGFEALEERAEELRNTWKLGLDPIHSLCHEVEYKGIHVILTDLPQSIQGFSSKVGCRDQSVLEVMVISKHLNVERRRFAMACELARIIARSTVNLTIGHERAVRLFAGAFLVPRESLVDLLGENRNRITYFEIIQLKHFFGVAASVVFDRIGQTRILPPREIKRAYMTFARSWREKEPEPISTDDLFVTMERPRRFKLLVAHALGEGLFAPVRATSLLNLPLDEVEKMF